MGSPSSANSSETLRSLNRKTVARTMSKESQTRSETAVLPFLPSAQPTAMGSLLEEANALYKDNGDLDVALARLKAVSFSRLGCLGSAS